MNDIQIRYFWEELKKHQFFSNAFIAVQKNNSWFDAKNDELITNADLLNIINARKSGEKFRKFPDPWKVCLWAPKSNICVVVEVARKTQESTIAKNYELLISTINIATKFYYANHDTLTGVLNRHGIQWELERVIPSWVNENADVLDINQELPVDNEIALFTFDLDRFKSINDTYGHAVGDAVLQIFATRLNSIAPDLQKSFSVSCVFGRPGGEEFELVVCGKAGAVPIDKIVERLLAGIRSPNIPSPEDVKRIQKKYPSAGAVSGLANVTNKVTASIGVATKIVNKNTAATDEMYSELRRDADVALYRAKSDGRDCCRLFSDIRIKHGRVHEYHKNSNLIVADIGSDVGVRKSDVYRVFFPPFLGRDINVGDERGAKKLGRYPHVESVRVIVIDVQERASTCALIDCSTSIDVPNGALLQYIHTGSVPFLYDRPRQIALNLLPANELPGYIEQLLNTDSLHSVIRIKGKFRENDERDRDDKLSEVISGIYLFFPAGTTVFGGNGCGIYLVLKQPPGVAVDKEEKITILRKTLGELESLCGGLTAGIYVPGNVDAEIVETGLSIVFYCNVSLMVSDNKVQEKKFVIFKDGVPRDCIYKWRSLRAIEDALIDYQAFKRYGFDKPAQNNQLGLAVLESRKEDYYLLGEVSFSLAHSIDPNAKVYKANLALMKAIRGDFEAAYNLFLTIEDYVLSSATNIYLLAYSKSALESSLKSAVPQNDKLPKLFSQTLAKFKGRSSNMLYDTWLDDILAVFQPEAV